MVLTRASLLGRRTGRSASASATASGSRTSSAGSRTRPSRRMPASGQTASWPSATRRTAC
eukprot:9817687-Alexandrium_andersonii.AAC.1